jgi:Leishmanolysin
MFTLSHEGIFAPEDENGFVPWVGREAPNEDVVAFDRRALLAAPLDPGAELAAGDGGGSADGDPAVSAVLARYASGKTAPGKDVFNIDIAFQGAWTAALQQAFIDAVAVSEAIIVEGLQDVFYNGQVIDDIVITAELKSIDGLGGVLGRAGPTAIRTANNLPATANMQFDAADALRMPPALWADVIQHEMFHCLGFGSLWDKFTVNGKPIVLLLDSSNPIYVGPAALARFNALAPDDATKYSIPIEGGGGAGTKGSHWREGVLHEELMTGYLNNVDAILSTITAAAFQDFGYGIANPIDVAETGSARFSETTSSYDFV